MFKEFSEFNFEIIDITVAGVPELFVNINGLTINKKAVEDMGYPQNVLPLLDVQHKVFAVQACRKDVSRAIHFAKAKEEQNSGVSLQSTGLFNTVRNMMGDAWNPQKRYRVKGIYYPAEKAMLFDLTTADELDSIRQTRKKGFSNSTANDGE